MLYRRRTQDMRIRAYSAAAGLSGRSRPSQNRLVRYAPTQMAVMRMTSMPMHSQAERRTRSGFSAPRF